MKVRILLAVVILASPGSVLAQELPAPSGPKMETVQDKASYGFGFQIGRQIKGQGLDLTLQMLVRGIQDGIAGQKPALPDQELFAAMQDYQRSVLTRLAMKNKADGEAFLKANREKEGVVTLESGLQYQVLKQGNGPSPRPTDRVRTHYHGTLIDGSVFDSSVEQGEPVTFGVTEVIAGWTEALQRMKVGDKWRIFLPSELAYGGQGAGAEIGPNSALIFEIELLGIEE